jgi:hypothetical protein
MSSCGIVNPNIAKCPNDPAKALVMRYIRRLIANGSAEWTLFDNGDIQLSFNTGETFLLADRAIVRLA